MRDTDQEDRNKAIVLDYYEKLIGQWDYQAASVHLGDHFIQHNPTIEDGLTGLRNFVEGVPAEIKPMLSRKVARVMADGDLVMVHTLFLVGGKAERAIADIFRLQDGKVVEHWDVIQMVPDEAVHENGLV